MRMCIYIAFFHCMNQSIKMHLDMGQKMYIFISFHIVTITRRVTFFSPKVSIITNVILILYNSSINKKLI